MEVVDEIDEVLIQALQILLEEELQSNEPSEDEAA